MHDNELFPKDSLSLMSPKGLLWLQHTIKPGTSELWNTEHWNTGRTPEHWNTGGTYNGILAEQSKYHEIVEHVKSSGTM